MSFGRFSDSGVGIIDVETLAISTLTARGKTPRGRQLTQAGLPLFAVQTWSERNYGLPMLPARNPKRLAVGGWPVGATDGKSLYFHSRKDLKIHQISVNPPGKPVAVCDMPYTYYPAITADGKRVAYPDRENLVVLDIATRQAAYHPPSGQVERLLRRMTSGWKTFGLRVVRRRPRRTG